jgi:archaellum biogenesis ATPase FlaH
MSVQAEREILGQLILAPRLLESCDALQADLFSTPDHRKAFAGLSALWEELRPESIDPGILAEKTELYPEFVAGLVSGNYRPDPVNFAWRVRQLRRRRISERILRVSEDEGQHLVKTGEVDAAKLEEVRGLFLELDEKPAAGPAFKRLSEIEGRQIDWLWRGRIPRGMLTLLAGDPGLGKSFLATWLASRLSTGAALPGDSGQAPGVGTVYLSAEDSAAYALQPRAARNGADLSKIIVFEDSEFDIGADLEKIRAIVKTEPGIQLVIIDPLNSYLGTADYLRDPEVRAKLNPLVQFCEETRIACLAVMHLNKKTDQAGIYRIGGSIAFAGVARSILAVTQDPEDPDRRFLRPLKMNYTRKPDPLAFRIGEDLALAFEDGPADIGADESLTPPTGREAVEGSFVEGWLKERLAGESADLRDILSAAKEVGISRSALFRAKAKLGVKTRPFGYRDKKTSLWELPNA